MDAKKTDGNALPIRWKLIHFLFCCFCRRKWTGERGPRRPLPTFSFHTRAHFGRRRRRIGNGQRPRRRYRWPAPKIATDAAASLPVTEYFFFLRPSFSVWLLFPVRNGVFVFRNYQSNSEPLIDKDFYLKQKKEIGHVDGFFFNRIFTSTRMPSVTDECDIRPRETASASFVLDGRSFSPRFNRPITEFLRRNSVRRPFFFQSNIHLLVSMNSSRQTRYTFLHSFDTYRKRHQVVVVFFNAISVDESDSLFSVSYWILRWNSVKKSEQTNATLWYGRNTSPTVRTNESRQLHWAFEEAPMNSNDKKPRLLASYRVLPSFSGFAFERWWRNSRSSTKTPIFRFLSLLSIRQP